MEPANGTSSDKASSSTSAVADNDESVQVPLIHDNLTFDNRQAMRLKEMEKRICEETKKKKRDWERDVERMREEFLKLHPVDKKWASDDNLVSKRRGSTDVLDSKKMKTLILDYPDSGRGFKVRFNMAGFDTANIRVATDGERIIVRATRSEEGDDGVTVEREYERKIEKPKEVDHSKLKSYLTTDAILIIEAPLPPKTLNLRKTNHSSPSRSIHESNASVRSSSPATAITSPPGSPTPTMAKEKYGVPVFHDDNGRRKMSLTVDIGHAFTSKEITALIIKENRIQIKARHEERTLEKLCKNKYMKEFEMPEKIETYSLRGGLTSDGRLIVGALAKGHCTGLSKVAAGEAIEDDINSKAENQSCNVLDLSSFPPTTPQIIASAYNYNG